MCKKFLCFCLAAFLFITGCGRCSLTKKEDVFAVVDRKCISKSDFFTKVGLYNVQLSGVKDAESFLNGMINDVLILRQAKKDKVGITGGELNKEIESFVPGYSPAQVRKLLKNGRIKYKSWLKDIKEKVIIKKEINYVMKNKITIEDSDLKDYFWTNIIDFRTAFKVRARQIVVDDIDKAKEIRKQLLDKASFEELAKKHSTASEASAGGDLGYFRKKDMPAFMTNVVFKMKKGHISYIVKSPYGYHIFKCEDIREANTPKFEDVKDVVYETFFEEKKDEYFNSWLEDIRKNSDIIIEKENIEAFFKEAKK